MMSEYKEGVDYVFVIPEDDNNSVDIRINSGEYFGVVYNYGKVSVEEDRDNDQAYLAFEYNVVDPNGIEDIESNIGFKNHIGDILSTIMVKNMNMEKDSEVVTE
jgi:hypothetical protein